MTDLQLAILTCPDHSARCNQLIFCTRATIREIVIIVIKFHQNRSRGLGNTRSKIANYCWRLAYIRLSVTSYTPIQCKPCAHRGVETIIVAK